MCIAPNMFFFRFWPIPMSLGSLLQVQVKAQAEDNWEASGFGPEIQRMVLEMNLWWIYGESMVNNG